MATPTPFQARRRANRRHRVVVLSALLILWTAACGSEPQPRLSGILITLDTTNPGALDCYGENLGHTPALLAIAAESLAYDEARTVTPLTLPAHSSMFTGLYPPRHTVRDNGLTPLPMSAETLAERAQAAGFQTAAFAAAAVLSRPYGLAQGFDTFDCPGGDSQSAAALINERRGDAVSAAALKWVRARDKSRPLFLWVHFFDAHIPYEPPADYLARANGDAYLGEVAWLDSQVGVLLAGLRAEGLLDESLLAIVADHGEARGQHGEQSHGSLAFDATMRVPFLLRYPDGYRAGERSSALVSVVDVLPTFAAACGLPPTAGIDGTSLFKRDPAGRSGVYFESYMGFLNYGWSPLSGWTDGRYKYIHSSSPQLFDVVSDRDEERDLYEPAHAALQSLRSGIRSVALGTTLEQDGFAGFSEELRNQIQALGYAGLAEADTTLPNPLAQTQLPSPRLRQDEQHRIENALALAARRRPGVAIEQLQSVRADYPDNPTNLLHLAGMLQKEQRHAEAVPLFEELLALGPMHSARQEAWICGYLAFQLESQNAAKPALARYKRAFELEPTSIRWVNGVRRMLKALGRTEELEQYKRHAELLKSQGAGSGG